MENRYHLKRGKEEWAHAQYSCFHFDGVGGTLSVVYILKKLFTLVAALILSSYICRLWFSHLIFLILSQQGLKFDLYEFAKTLRRLFFFDIYLLLHYNFVVLCCNGGSNPVSSYASHWLKTLSYDLLVTVQYYFTWGIDKDPCLSKAGVWWRQSSQALNGVLFFLKVRPF